MNMIPSPTLTRIVLATTLIVLGSSCARHSVWQKSTIIVTSAGTAGAIVLTSNYATAGTTLATGVGAAVIGGGATMIIDALDATPSQIRAAETAGRRYLQALDAEKRKFHKEPGKGIIAIPVGRTSRSRGHGSVMLYNTQKRKLESKKVYDVRTLPKIGTTMKFELCEAEYIGVLPMLVGRPQKSVSQPVAAPLASDATP